VREKERASSAEKPQGDILPDNFNNVGESAARITKIIQKAVEDRDHQIFAAFSLIFGLL
jgi:hypothetical protein